MERELGKVNGWGGRWRAGVEERNGHLHQRADIESHPQM